VVDEIAIVTAAGQGIGRACAVRFAAEGAHVPVNDVRDEAAAAVWLRAIGYDGSAGTRPSCRRTVAESK
jgi:NAD(P)-dependent dehydrogenase (short-subunit alcohol dehydrogenase family)